LWQIFSACAPTFTFLGPVARLAVARGSDFETGFVGARDQVVGELALPLADRGRADLRDDVDPFRR
jgi:hypothetical protein